ncbi:hypothetical protein EST38_g7857 [Candolleomyces aberdarensis]|uniref:CAP-Gly domain-containing protein n=1 Tax=Candolleomyces aberdarensis TaxID=2316362 RepID=A0A4Q2DGX6_9AGAR|nr:hypothetical protein EST38_g7857 [Candolleomyces aberdarensis]
MSGILNLWVKSPDTHSERRIDPHLTVEQLKGKLELITGIPAGNQAITLLESESDPRVVANLDDDTKKIGFYGLRDWQVLKLTLPDSVLAYKQRNKVGRFAENAEDEPTNEAIDENVKVGARCEVESSEKELKKRGTIRFVGSTKFGKGIWVGIEYDEPLGKNNGSVQGEQYFSCRDKYGVFVRPDRVTAGDFPVEELDLDEEM